MIGNQYRIKKFHPKHTMKKKNFIDLNISANLLTDCTHKIQYCRIEMGFVLGKHSPKFQVCDVGMMSFSKVA